MVFTIEWIMLVKFDWSIYWQHCNYIPWTIFVYWLHIYKCALTCYDTICLGHLPKLWNQVWSPRCTLHIALLLNYSSTSKSLASQTLHDSTSKRWTFVINISSPPSVNLPHVGPINHVLAFITTLLCNVHS